MHEGHRKRMLQRLRTADALQDHELLEILLFYAIPRKNTNPIAHELLSSFGSLSGVLNASPDELKGVFGIGDETAAFLRCVGLLYERAHTVREEQPKLFSVRDFSDFLCSRYRTLAEETIEVFCLDGQQRVKCSKRFGVSEPDRASLAPEQLARVLSSVQPRGLVLAHNHPFAPAIPSAADDRFTAQVQLICSLHGVTLYDHIIIGTDGAYSYYLVGRMESIRRDFDVATLLGGKFV